MRTIIRTTAVGIAMAAAGLGLVACGGSTGSTTTAQDTTGGLRTAVYHLEATGTAQNTDSRYGDLLTALVTATTSTGPQTVTVAFPMDQPIAESNPGANAAIAATLNGNGTITCWIEIVNPVTREVTVTTPQQRQTGIKPQVSCAAPVF